MRQVDFRCMFSDINSRISAGVAETNDNHVLPGVILWTNESVGTGQMTTGLLFVCLGMYDLSLECFQSWNLWNKRSVEGSCGHDDFIKVLYDSL
jgi:hypothetical protein